MLICTGNPGSREPPTVLLFDLAGELSVPAPLEGHKGQVSTATFSPDGRRAATGSDDKTVRLWTMDDLDHPRTLVHPDKVHSVAFSPDGKTLATSTYLGGLWLWDASTGETIGEPLVKHNTGPWGLGLRFSPDGKRLVAVSVDGTIRVWDIAARTFHSTPRSTPGITAQALSPDGRLLATARADKDVQVYQLDTLTVAQTFKGHWENIWTLAFSPDGKTLASGSFDGTAKLWDVTPLAATEAENE